MPNPLVECIPNYSEARRPEVVDAILASIQAVSGVHILDRHSDLDHNRTVLTLVGAPAAVEEAAFQSIATAARLIDLNTHTGAHPRIGATDVVPFVPISDVSMQECVEMAHRLGKRVGDELQIPVYLYEDAAARPERTNLENIRRGQFEALKEEMGVKPERNPDFGPARVSGAGATVIGARQPLIAFNVYLTTDDVTIAKKIATAVRNSSGGLRFVKGMGVLVDGRAQVSMNLTNYRQTPIARVVETVRREAQRYGVGIHHSELVGLIPQEALVNAAVWYTQLDQFEPEQILEQRLFGVMSAKPAAENAPTAPDFLDELASATPTPGGGCAAAHSGAAGAALVAMVARLTVSKKKYESVKDQMWALIEKAETARAALNAALQKDAAAFDAVMAAFKLPKETPEQEAMRSAAVKQATYQAAIVPLEVGRLALDVMKMGLQAATLGNINAISDAGVSVAMCRAAITGASLNVRINLAGIEDAALAAPLLAEIASIEAQAAAIEADLNRVLKERANI